MRTLPYLIATSLVLFSIIVSCKKDETVPDFHYGYFGFTPGRYVDYSVMEVSHDVSQSIPHDTTRYFMRTFIGDTITDNEGRIGRRFIRYKKDNLSDPWVLADNWTAILTSTRAELVEENQRVIKLVFAPTDNKEWNANSFNMFDPLNCYYMDIHEEKSIGNLIYDSTLVVEQEDYITLIDYRRKFEVYAKNVGLIYKHYKDLTIAGFDTLNVQKGDELFYKCIGYGFQ